MIVLKQRISIKYCIVILVYSKRKIYPKTEPLFLYILEKEERRKEIILRSKNYISSQET